MSLIVGGFKLVYKTFQFFLSFKWWFAPRAFLNDVDTRRPGAKAAKALLFERFLISGPGASYKVSKWTSPQGWMIVMLFFMQAHRVYLRGV